MIDLADRPDVAPELRLVPHAFRETFGRPAQGVWYAPGVLTLLPGVTVNARWGAIVAGEARADGILELASINKPAERIHQPIAEVTAVPAWAEPILDRLRPQFGGATLLCSVDLPRGSGLAPGKALACAAELALGDLYQAPVPVPAEGIDLDQGLRLLVIDTRVRRDVPVRTVSTTIGRMDLGSALTAFHRAQSAEPVQDLVVATALGAGALGASMLVDDPGRPAVALVRAEDSREIRTRVVDACLRAGFVAPRFLTVSPCRGAYRVA